MMDISESPALAIKSVVGGGFEDKSWTSAISHLQVQLRGSRSVNEDPFGLTVTFFVPGEVYGPKFSGIRIGTFLEEFRTLVVQVALPEHPEGDARSEALDLLDEAIRKAEAWGKRKKFLSGQLQEVREVAASLRVQN
ncbi:hypothetical protein [Streptomyces sp. NBC_00162]|uniref:hypothetical protein n=1 Tax=Streptomyces sp. NBC_00162 TaxID=2903629 RepID=UPI00214B7561|nr:hypothetical protein [Streptomyces sp. NBC_00162]UUU41677.1 hypothetical protein JIW86_24365 [Streptomyces sp. NBC_00162]